MRCLLLCLLLFASAVSAQTWQQLPDFPGAARDMGRIYAQIVEELRGRYTIGYRPDGRGADGRFRKLEVRVKKPGVKARARRGYYSARF